MLDKNKVIDSLHSLPDNFTLDELIDRLVLVEKIEKGLEQSKEGKVYSSAEAKQQLKRWLK